MVLIGLLAVQFFPWFTFSSLSSSLLRDDELPGYVTEQADWLDANRRDASTGRVWEIPAADFANYRWGGTVDPVLPGILDRPYLARELVPQGGVATADLLNAFERRLPEGSFEPEALAPIAGLLGVDTIAVRNDLEHERYRLARPGTLWSTLTDELGAPDHLGPLVVDETEIPLIDERTLAAVDRVVTFPAVAAFDLAPAPIVRSRSADSPVVMAGSAEGIVDLAGAELLDPDRLVLFAATLDDLQATGEFDPAMVGSDPWWVVTDTNRRQARHWSTVSSNLGALETADGPITLDDDPGDQQLDVFLPDDAGAEPRQTVADHVGDVADVRASYYGNRVAFTTGDAPHFAIDGDPATAWRAGVFDPTTGLQWEVDLVEPVAASSIGILQPITGATNRFIVDARITLDAGLDTETVVDITLDETSRSLPGQTIGLPTDSFQTLRFEVRSDNIGDLADYTGWPGVGLAEVTIPGVHDDRVVRVPSPGAFDVGDAAERAEQRLTYLFTRQRIDPATANVSSAEAALVRQFTVEGPRSLHARGRISCVGRLLRSVARRPLRRRRDGGRRSSPQGQSGIAWCVGVRRRPRHGLADAVRRRRRSDRHDRPRPNARCRPAHRRMARRRLPFGADRDHAHC